MSVQKAFEQAVMSLRPAPVVVEVGAHVGDGVKFVLSKSPRAIIYAVEPCKKSYRKLVGFHRLSYNVAITDGKGSKGVAKIGNARQYRIVDGQSELFHSTLDDFIFHIDVSHIDMLRFDCYGSEYSIFHSENDFLSITDMICITLHKQQVCECNVKAERKHVYKCLESAGFTQIAQYGNGPKKHSFELWRRK